MLHKFNPDWTHQKWDEAQLRSACEEYGPECVKRFDSYEHFIQKVDFGRYVILFLYGGVTVDCDMEPLRPLSAVPEIDFSPLILGKSNDSKFETSVISFGQIKNDNWFVNNGFIACQAGNSDMKRLIETCIQDNTKREDYLSHAYFVSATTGPIRVSTVLKDCNMTILYPDLVDYEYPTEKTIFIHNHELSWTGDVNALIFKGYLFVKEHKPFFLPVLSAFIFIILAGTRRVK
jgi:mannosyltransferase OCH1-like enzyme